MKIKILPVYFISATLLNFISCTHDPVIPATPEISFDQQIKPIFINNCARSGCHDGGELDLQSYDDIRARVTPGNARNSDLFKVITRLSGSAMPPDGPLSDQQITLIYAWIMQGAKNN